MESSKKQSIPPREVLTMKFGPNSSMAGRQGRLIADEFDKLFKENDALKAENEKLKQELKQEKKIQGCELAFHRTQYFKFVKDPSIVCNKCIYKYSPRDTACENCFCHDRKNEKIHFEFLHEMGG